MPQEATVLLVEADAPERERLGAALEEGGHEVIVCPGPVAPDYTCVGGREGYCPLLERADVVVFDPWLPGDEAGIGTSSGRLLELYLSRGRTTIVLGTGGWLDPPARGHVIHLRERPAADEVLAAVRMAPDVEGLVLRKR